MRHRKRDIKLGRSSSHRKALIAHLVVGLIKEQSIKTTLAKAKLSRRVAEKMVTLGRRDGTPAQRLAARRQAVSTLMQTKTVEKAIKTLFEDIVPQFGDRQGGYTRIIRLGLGSSDVSEMVILEWVGLAPKVKKTDTDEAAA